MTGERVRGTEVPGTPSLVFACMSRHPQRKCGTERKTQSDGEKEPEEEKSVMLMVTFMAWESWVAARLPHH